MSVDHPYRGVRAALATRHGKERVIGPALASLGISLELAAGIDTDRYGTFTREIARAGTQLEAARAKAGAASGATGLPRAVASEGAFGPDPVGGLIGWGREIVLWVDATLGIEVSGSAQGPSNFASATVTAVEQALAFAAQAGFPEHALVVRPAHAEHPELEKGLAERRALIAAVERALRATASRTAFIETDLRAHLNPTRMAMIGRAAEDLARRLASLCPRCGAPGYAALERVSGLPCADCGLPTRQWRAERLGCVRCGHRQEIARGDRREADPAHCEHCNP
jgi:ribosomal protein L37E